MSIFDKGIPASRRTLLLATILAAGSCGLWAQDTTPSGPPPEGRMGQRGNPEREIAQLTQALSLTPDQQAQVKALLKERREKVEALRANGERPSREQMQAIRKDSDTKINAVLNDDQKSKYAAWEEQHRRGPRGPGGDAPPPPPVA